MKTISILGCGWLGMPLGAGLVNQGYEVQGSSRAKSKLDEIDSKGMKPFLVDLNGKEDLPKAFFDADVIVLNVPPSNADSQEKYFDQLNNFLGSVSTETHVLFVGSTGVYPNLNRVVTEDDADESATSRSGISLLKAERKFHSPNNTVVRFGGLIDNRRHPGIWFAGKEGLAAGNEPVNMIHLEDCIGAIVAIVEQDCWGQIFNVCSQDHPKKAAYYPVMSSKLGLEPAKYDLKNPNDWKIVSSEKFTTTIAYEFKRSIWEI